MANEPFDPFDEPIGPNPDGQSPRPFGAPRPPQAHVDLFDSAPTSDVFDPGPPPTAFTPPAVAGLPPAPALNPLNSAPGGVQPPTVRPAQQLNTGMTSAAALASGRAVPASLPGLPSAPPLTSAPVPPAGPVTRVVSAASLRAPAAAAAPPPATPTVSVEGTPSYPQFGFFQQRWVQDLLPLLTSVVVHVAIVAGGLLVFVAVSQEGPKVKEQEQTIIPVSTLSDSGKAGGVPNTGLNDNPLKQAMQDTTPDAGAADGWSDKSGPTVDPSAVAGKSAESADSSLISLGANGIGSGKVGVTGSGSGDGGGPLAMFGNPGGGAIGPKGPVFGDGGNARQIMFVCDATGTMIDKIGTLKHELTKAIEGLQPIQSFNVVFYTDGGKFSSVDISGLLMANTANKRKAYAYLDSVTPVGTTDPIPALELGFRQRPQLLYFLSDGEFNNLKSYNEVMDAIRRFNGDKRVKINTILFDTFEKQAEEIMKKIASENGGTYRYVREADLQ